MYYARIESDAKAKAAHDKDQAANAAERLKRIASRKKAAKTSGKLA